MSEAPDRLRSIPAVDRLLDLVGSQSLPHSVVVRVIRSELARIRKRKRVPAENEITSMIRGKLDELSRSRLQPVINATGIIANTNLGRVPLNPDALRTAFDVGRGYSNLEYNLTKGDRGTRAAYHESLLEVLCGSEAAAIVNNCAAALVLAISHFTCGAKKEVIVSRGELIQIGGGFRIPEVLEAAGAILREVGTTNRTSLDDYKRVAGPETAMILKVHRSNFFMDGFTGAPTSDSLASFARKSRLPLVEDLGSGALTAIGGIDGNEREPTPKELLKTGVDLVCFSGDKLLGGPQAGIIVGRKRYVDGLKRSPIFRALRCDKLILGVLQHVLEQYLKNDSEQEIPVLAMMAKSTEQLRPRAENLAVQLAGMPVDIRVIDAFSRVGGGALPRTVLPSVALEIRPRSCTSSQLASRLRLGEPPVIGYLSGKRYLLNLTTVFPDQDVALADAVRCALRSSAE